MDWANERYVRLYTRTSADMIAVGWEGRLVWYELLRHVDLHWPNKPEFDVFA